MRRLFGIIGITFIVAVLLVPPQPARAAHTFYGIVRHVSTSNLKVYNPKSHQTLSFEIVPKFKQIFSEDGKTTYQMAHIHPGQYVRIDYDQHLLGVRHANRITLLSSLDKYLGHQ